MKMLLYFILFLFTFHLIMVVGTFQGAKPGCQTECANITVPYPFGIGTNCSFDPWFNLTCDSTSDHKSPKLFNRQFGGRRIYNIYNISDSEIRVSTEVSNRCYSQTRVVTGFETVPYDLSGYKTFTISAKNTYTVVGCDDYVLLTGLLEDDLNSGCFGLCNRPQSVPKGQCLGTGCCQISIPKGLSYFNAQLDSFQNHSNVWFFNECGFGFLVEEGVFQFGGLNDLSTNYSDFVSRIESTMPVVFDWVLAPDGNCTSGVNACTENSSCYDVQGGGYRCKCKEGYEGNPYLHPGCQDIDECQQDQRMNQTYTCYGNCIHTVGSYSCTCPQGHFGNPKIRNGCIVNPKQLSAVIFIIIGVSIGVLFLVAIIVVPKQIKKSNQKRQRKRYFTHNGGLLLKQQEEADSSLVDKTILYTSRELEKATDNFNENKILGRGGHGTVYKGMLVDGRIVAVKKSKIVDESELEEFINEVVVLSQVNHRNVVKLFGCCLETEVPLLVSEFIPNGTLYDRLHNETEEFPISLNMRLQIAAEVAGAVAYLHSATSIPIYHRDIKTSNILLDEKYRAKVSDFGTSRFVLKEQTHLTTIVKGTFGYLDPEYFQSSQFTEKSDVYSFGVVLVELLTREKPISLTRFGENRSLATHFMVAMEEGRVMSIFDALIIKEGTRDDLLAVANLAKRCLNMNGKYRPTMKEVAAELETVRASHIPSADETNIRHVMHQEELLMLSYGEPSSTFLSFNDSITR